MTQRTTRERKVAKLFQNGGSQAVRLPAEFRFDADEVYVSRDEATGDVTLSTRSSKQVWQDMFDDVDSYKVSDRDWDAYMARIEEARRRAVVDDRGMFDDELNRE